MTKNETDLRQRIKHARFHGETEEAEQLEVELQELMEGEGDD